MSIFGLQFGKNKSSNSVDVPDWLMPFMQQGVGVGTDALRNLQNMGNRNTVAAHTPMYDFGRNWAVRRLNGEGGFLPMTEDVLMSTAGGQGVGNFLPPEAYEGLTGMASGTGPGIPGTADRTLSEMSRTGALPGVSRNALRSTARGDYLFGGQGFDRAIEAALNSAAPKISSAFGGRSAGGLEKVALQQVATDAFANQYAQERANQLGAAGTMSNNAMGASGMYGGFADSAANRQLQSALGLAGFGDRERNRQIDAASALPEYAMFAPGVRMQLGEEERNLAQRRIDAPFERQMQLLMAAMGLPGSYSPFFGSSQRGRAAGFSFGGEG